MRHIDIRTVRAFSLIELVVVIVVLAILAGVAIMKQHDLAGAARASADGGSLSAINEALNQKYLANRMSNATSASWITTPAQVASVMHWDSLPAGISISGGQFIDQRGNAYVFTAETQTQPARIALGGSGAGGSSGGGASAPSSGGAGGGTSGGSGGSGGAAAVPEAALAMIVLAPWLGRRRRGERA